MNIILTGFMGAGKTTVGRKLANRLGYYFLDTDAYIEAQQGCKIAEIFNYAGEDAFRNLETKLLQHLLNLQNTVVSTGGGMVLRLENRELLRQIGRVVYLKVDEKTLLQRLQSDQQRPLLQQENWQQNVCRMLQQREAYYAEADLTVIAHDGPPQAMVSQIIASL
jgi:shikimate kinase